ncbi:unnamed protein product [Spirodela intermedia]|uniref:Uncharacterized protein n=1 Tax=Spirodela intermedia TaxID=51605 RepID=A0A7I8J0I4_SPIIN|nr:unnamed protein product [Spirodela intermedia]CAA6662830.1 unnamed protein product [Spirodela intermedia]
MLQEIGFLGCKLETSSIKVYLQFWDTLSPLLDLNWYRQFLGKLIYLIITHPNIMYTVSILSQLQESRRVHWVRALRVLTYIKRSLEQGLIYLRHDHLCIVAYSDIGYADDKGDQKSTTNYCTYISSNLVIWWSQK